MLSVSNAEYVLEGVRFVASLVYLMVGFIVLQRDVEPHDRPALVGFGLWWIGLGIVGFYSIPFGLGLELAAMGMVAVRFVLYTLFPLLFVALAGLLFYLLYLYTGKRTVLPAVVTFYAALLLVTLWLVEGFGPYIGVDPETGELAVLYQREHPAWVTFAFGLALILPPLAAATAYFLLFFRVEDRLARYRIAMVSLGILVWFGYSLFAATLRFITDGGAQTIVGRSISQSLGLLSSLMVLAAFLPPPPVRRWLGLGEGRPVAQPEVR